MLPWLEKHLLKQIKSGNEPSFAKAYDLYADKIYKFVFSKINSSDIAEEIVQDAFTRFWQFARKDDSDIYNIKSLLYKIARNLIIDYYRAKRPDEIPIDEPEFQAELSVTPDNDKSLDLEFDLKQIESSLTQLPSVYQDVIIMKFVNDLSHREIAGILDKTESHIRVLIHRALQALREKLKSNK